MTKANTSLARERLTSAEHPLFPSERERGAAKPPRPLCEVLWIHSFLHPLGIEASDKGLANLARWRSKEWSGRLKPRAAAVTVGLVGYFDGQILCAIFQFDAQMRECH